MVRAHLNRHLRILRGHTLRLSIRGGRPVTGIVEEVHLHCLVMRDRRGHRHYCPTKGILGFRDGTAFFRTPVSRTPH